MASSAEIADSPAQSSSPPMKKRGRPIKGTNEGIGVGDDTLRRDGSERAKKRRQKDREMSPTSAAIQRAKNADRARKSQVLKKLKESDAWASSSPEQRNILEANAVADLMKHRQTSGQLAEEKHPDEFYDSMDEFIEDDVSDNEAGFDDDEEDDTEDERSAMDEEENDDEEEEDNDTDADESGDGIDAEDGTGQDEATFNGSDTVDAREEEAADSTDDGISEVSQEHDTPDADLDEDMVKEFMAQSKETRKYVASKLSEAGLRGLLSKRYEKAAETYEWAKTERNRVRMEESRAALEEYDQNPNGPNLGTL